MTHLRMKEKSKFFTPNLTYIIGSIFALLLIKGSKVHTYLPRYSYRTHTRGQLWALYIPGRL